MNTRYSVDGHPARAKIHQKNIRECNFKCDSRQAIEATQATEELMKCEDKKVQDTNYVVIYQSRHQDCVYIRGQCSDVLIRIYMYI